jgi:hypothetical protein
LKSIVLVPVANQQIKRLKRAISATASSDWSQQIIPAILAVLPIEGTIVLTQD